MCKFCEALLNKKEIIWHERSTLSGDNMCEYASGNLSYANCVDCYGCENRNFTLTPYEHDGNVMVTIKYYRNSHNVVVAPFTESMQFSFCPFCGVQISKTIKNFEDCWQYYIDEE